MMSDDIEPNSIEADPIRGVNDTKLRDGSSYSVSDGTSRRLHSRCALKRVRRTAQIMRVFQRFPDRYLSPRDVASALNYRDLPHIRMRLSRMVKAKKLQRVGHGRYMGVTG